DAMILHGAPRQARNKPGKAVSLHPPGRCVDRSGPYSPPGLPFHAPRRSTYIPTATPDPHVTPMDGESARECDGTQVAGELPSTGWSWAKPSPGEGLLDRGEVTGV